MEVTITWKLSEERVSRLMEECSKFKVYNNIQEYEQDVFICLVNSSWHYSEDRVRELMLERMDYIQEAYRSKEPAFSCMAEVGYHCG